MVKYSKKLRTYTFAGANKTFQLKFSYTKNSLLLHGLDFYARYTVFLLVEDPQWSIMTVFSIMCCAASKFKNIGKIDVAIIKATQRGRHICREAADPEY